MTNWYRRGATKKEPLHYPECGLDEVYLNSGYSYDNDGNVVIDDIDGLFEAIGKWVANQPRSLAPREIRFLRKQVGLSQGQLGLMLGCDAQSVARWEKGQSTNGPADRMLRTIYMLKHSKEVKDEIEEMLGRLVELHAQLQDGKVNFGKPPNEEWRADAA